jgi:hypothetical protein
MAVTNVTRYKEDYVEAYELRKAVLVPTVRNDTQDNGGSLVFLVAGSGSRSAVTRGPNGDIPPADDSQTQVTLNFAEAHDYKRYTAFDIFKAQGNQLKLMRDNSLSVIHRKQDSVIITAAETGTVTLGAVGTMNMLVAQRISTILRNAHVGSTDAGNITAVISPAAFNYMMNITGFSNSDYTATKKVDDGIPLLTDMRYWMGIQWIAHDGLNGVGTTSTNFAYHKDAIGYAVSTRGLDVQAGRNEEQDYSYTRASIFHAAVKLQNAGIVKWTHDDSGLSA